MKRVTFLIKWVQICVTNVNHPTLVRPAIFGLHVNLSSIISVVTHVVIHVKIINSNLLLICVQCDKQLI